MTVIDTNTLGDNITRDNILILEGKITSAEYE